VRFWAYSLSPIGFLAAALVVMAVRGVPIPEAKDFARFSGLPELGLPTVALLVLLIGGYGEELGWRGFALERLPAFTTTCVIVWAVTLLVREWTRPRSASLLMVTTAADDQLAR
jgi:membrane protease YdiL (CAAX protease family)